MRRWQLITAVVFVGLVLTFDAFLGVRYLIRRAAFNPLYLGVYNITNTVPGYAGAADVVPGDLDGSWLKCNRSSHPVSYTASYEWNQVEPVTYVVPAGGGESFLPVGCVTRHYAISVPAAVLAEVNAEAKAGTRETVWRLQGENTPTRPGSVTTVWISDQFELIVP